MSFLDSITNFFVGAPQAPQNKAKQANTAAQVKPAQTTITNPTTVKPEEQKAPVQVSPQLHNPVQAPQQEVKPTPVEATTTQTAQIQRKHHAQRQSSGRPTLFARTWPHTPKKMFSCLRNQLIRYSRIKN